MAYNQDCVINEEMVSYVKSARNDLQSDDFSLRKKTLQDLNNNLFPENGQFSAATYRTVFNECHLQVLKCFRDKFEICRELAIQLMSNFVQNLELSDYYLTYIFPVIVERIGTAELVEESEELRLEMVNFLMSIVIIYAKTEYLVPFLNDSVKILIQCIIDKFPKVKEAGSKCVIELANSLPRHFHLQCESMVKPILTNFSHQHFRIRAISIQAIGVIIMNSTSSSIIETTVGPLAERLFDQTALVRRAVIQVTARLLTEYRDRYSHFYRLLPLILTGLSDEVPDTKNESEKLWAAVGIQYVKENEQDLKDQLDFPIKKSDFYPMDVERPNLGCRILVQRNISKISGAICNELRSWQEDVRIRCAQLLYFVVLHCEQFFTQNLQDVLPTMYMAAMDHNYHVYEYIMAAARLLGIFVPIKSWSALMLPAVQESATFGHLRILRSLASGASKCDLATVATEIAMVLLAEPIRCGNRCTVYQTELVECCRTLMFCTSVTEQLFLILVSVVALSPSSDPTAGELARNLLTEIKNPEDFTAELLSKMEASDFGYWTQMSSDRCIFDTLLFEWSIAIMPHLSMVTPVLIRALDERCDAEARLRTFQALSTFFQQEFFLNIELRANCLEFVIFFDELIADVLLPSLIWRAGATAEALRTAAAYCTQQAFHHTPSISILHEGPDEAFMHLLTTILALLDDSSWRTRIYGTKALVDVCHLLRTTNNNVVRLRVVVNESVIQLLKKLDDPTNLVRREAMITLKELLVTPDLLSEVNLKALIDTVLMHLDDQGAEERNAALEILKQLGKGDCSYLMEKLRNDKHMFKNEESCDELIQYLNSLTI